MLLLAFRSHYWGRNSRDFPPYSFSIVFGGKKKIQPNIMGQYYGDILIIVLKVPGEGLWLAQKRTDLVSRQAGWGLLPTAGSGAGPRGISRAPGAGAELVLEPNS